MKALFGKYIKNYKISSPSVVALGDFDGIHLAHKALISTCANYAKSNNLVSVVHSFLDHPENIINNKKITKSIICLEQKLNIISTLGIDYTVIEDFDDDFLKLSPLEFVEKVLIDALNAKAVVVGFHYFFGYNGNGNVKLLKEICDEKGIKVIVIEPITSNSVIISSTEIRNSVINGKIEAANKMLGYNYFIDGKVIDGKKLGRQIGFPTINTFFDDNLIIPGSGVYFTNTIIDDKKFESITNVGNNPTFGECLKAETHILCYDKTIYGKNVKIEFLAKTRNEIKFSTISDLKNQLKDDISNREKFNKKIFTNILSCGKIFNV